MPFRHWEFGAARTAIGGTSRPASSRRVPSLDGLRALSISAVILGHLAGTRGFPAWVTRLVETRQPDVAHLGVRVFFVISGFLITGLLIKEHDRTGRISLQRFYLRRTLRIFPAYFVFLAVLALLARRHIVDVPRLDFLHALTYTINYESSRVWVVGHLWSLGVEEQFYLVWPAVVALAGLQRSRRVAIAVLCVVPLIRVAEATLGHLTLIDNTFETTADALAVGCLLALSRDALITKQWYSRIAMARWAAPALLMLGLLFTIRFRPWLLFGETFVNVAIALGIDQCVRRPQGAAGRVLNTRLLVVVGNMSYSLYLWQQLFLNRTAPGSLTAFPLNVGLAVACALASYYAVERPALRIRERLEAWLDSRRTRTLLSAPEAG